MPSGVRFFQAETVSFIATQKKSKLILTKNKKIKKVLQENVRKKNTLNQIHEGEPIGIGLPLLPWKYNYCQAS